MTPVIVKIRSFNPLKVDEMNCGKINRIKDSKINICNIPLVGNRQKFSSALFCSDSVDKDW